jgi:hypothetical protein
MTDGKKFCEPMSGSTGASAMLPQFTSKLREEADLVERFTQTYRMKFAHLIERLNAGEPPSDLASIRLCVEAVNMMLESQSQMARTIREMTGAEKAAA